MVAYTHPLYLMLLAAAAAALAMVFLARSSARPSLSSLPSSVTYMIPVTYGAVPCGRPCTIRSLLITTPPPPISCSVRLAELRRLRMMSLAIMVFWLRMLLALRAVPSQVSLGDPPRTLPSKLNCTLVIGAAGRTATPVGPVYPVGPVGPVGPVSPVGPVGPVSPVGPVGPVAPVGPVGPVYPVGPVTPVGPVGPVAPVGPVGPVVPVGPGSPGNPCGPGKP